MSSVVLVDDMGVDNVGFLIENLGADAAPLQYLRELVQNEIESILRAAISEGDIEIDFEEINGVPKLRITGNGEGMRPDEVADNINRLSASGGVQSFDKNFGIGAKITAGTRNPQGVMYKCWKDGEGSLTVLGRVEGRYGRLGFPHADGTVDYWVPLDPDTKPPIIDKHGVSVVLLGQSADEDTTIAPVGSDLPSQWVTAYLDRRYFEVPDHISIKVPRQIFDSDRDTVRTIYDQVRGQRYYLDKHSDHHGSIELPDVRASVWWWLLSEDITKGGKTWNNHGHVAALYQNELYDVHSGPSRTSALKDFGVYAGFSRVVLYVEPHNVLKANTPRTSLILKGNTPVNYAEIGAAFYEKMPEAIAAFMAGQVTTERGDHRKAIRKNLKEVEDELKAARYLRGRRGKLDHFDPEDGVAPATATTLGAPGTGSSRKGDASGRVGAEYLRRAEEERERRMRGEKIESDPAPKIVWDDKDASTISGRAATYSSRGHVITANAHYSFYKDMVEWALGQARERAPGDIGEDALVTLAEDEVRRWFEQALTEVVVVLRPMAHDAKWGPDVYRTALSDEGLTAAIVSHRWHMMSAIRRGLSGRLGGAKSAASVA
jgi:hypothetical protein